VQKPLGKNKRREKVYTKDDMPSEGAGRNLKYESIDEYGRLAWMRDVPRKERLWSRGQSPHIEDYIDIIAEKYNLSNEDKRAYFSKWMKIQNDHYNSGRNIAGKEFELVRLANK
jgi:hypothetical protein